MTKTHENAKALAVPKPKMMTFREFVEFRKNFSDQAVKMLVGGRKLIYLNRENLN